MANRFDKILFLGDSIFSSTAVSGVTSFTTLFAQAKSSITCTTISVSGGSYNNPSGGSFKASFDAAVSAGTINQDCVIIGTGINAINPHSLISPGSFALSDVKSSSSIIAEIDALVASIRASSANPHIIFILPLPLGKTGSAATAYTGSGVIDAMFAQLAVVNRYIKEQFEVFDVGYLLSDYSASESNSYYVAKSSLYESDLLHPNTDGHQVIANELEKVVSGKRGTQTINVTMEPIKGNGSEFAGGTKGFSDTKTNLALGATYSQTFTCDSSGSINLSSLNGSYPDLCGFAQVTATSGNLLLTVKTNPDGLFTGSAIPYKNFRVAVNKGLNINLYRQDITNALPQTSGAAAGITFVNFDAGIIPNMSDGDVLEFSVDTDLTNINLDTGPMISHDIITN